MKGYLLSDDHVLQLTALNTQEATFIPCDYGMGVCVGEHDFDPAAFSAHKSLLDGFSLPLVDVGAAYQATQGG